MGIEGFVSADSSQELHNNQQLEQGELIDIFREQFGIPINIDTMQLIEASGLDPKVVANALDLFKKGDDTEKKAYEEISKQIYSIINNPDMDGKERLKKGTAIQKLIEAA